MRLIALFFALFTVLTTMAQSKKELVAEVERLKSEIVKLKTPKEADLTDKHKKASYGVGILFGTNLQAQGGDSLNVESLVMGIQDVFQKKTPKMDQQECMTTVQEYMTNIAMAKSKKSQEEGVAFLNANKTKEGVKTTASGLQYKVISAGTGKAPTANDNVTVHYVGKLANGTEFDSSIGGEPATFGVSDVIPGWTEALQLMHEGDKWILFIPHDLAYGERGAGDQIPPFAVLIFEVELLKVN